MTTLRTTALLLLLLAAAACSQSVATGMQPGSCQAAVPGCSNMNERDHGPMGNGGTGGGGMGHGMM